MPAAEAAPQIVGDAYAILESITDGFFAVNDQWQFSYVNREAEKLLDHSRSELLGKNLWQMFPGLLGTEFERLYLDAMRDEQSASVTSFFPDHDRWYEVHVYPAPRGLTVYFRDVTAQIVTHKELHESELRFRLLADLMPQMVWIADANGVARFFNKQWVSYTGISIDSMPAEMVIARFLHPDDQAATQAAWSESLKHGKTYAIEHRIRSSTGEYRWFLVRAVPYTDPETATITRWFGTSTDVHDRKLSEVALNKSEQRYRSLFEGIDEGFCVIDMMFDENRKAFDYRFCETNPMFEIQTGLKNVIGRTAREIAPDLEPFWFERYGQVAISGKPMRFDSESKAMGRWFDVYAFRADEHTPSKIGIHFRDVTRRRSIERELANTVRDLQAIDKARAFQLELADRLRPLTSPDNIAAVACELLGRHLQAVRVVYLEIGSLDGNFKVGREWSSGAVSSLMGAAMRFDSFGPGIMDSLCEGKPLNITDARIHPLGADSFDAYEEIGARASLTIPLIKSGRLVAALSVHDSKARDWSANDIELTSDMAERTWASIESAAVQLALQAEQAQTQYILGSMTEGFVLMDHNWIVRQMNAEGLRMGQRAADKVLGHPHFEVWPGLKGSAAEAMYERVKASGVAESLEYRETLEGDGFCWMELRAYPALHGGLGVFYRDITERKISEEKLKDADRRKDEFLAMLAHELRNPLAPIGSAAALLQRSQLDASSIRTTSEIIGRQVGHMTKLVDDLLDVSRVTRGLISLEKTRLDIRHIANHAVEQIAPLIRARRHHLRLELTPHTMMVSGDEKRLVQVLANLLNNAAKYTPDGGNIVLTTSVHQQQVEIEVADDGIGIEPELTLRVFDLFAQAERTPDRASGGLGLGLALVKSLVELHGGTVSCTSEGQGKGSRFKVCLPRLEENSHTDASTLDSAQAQADARPLRILLVDDNVDAATMLAMLLEASGHYVAVDHDAYAALERVTAEVPDVFLLDIGLPEMDGIELARRLRAKPETARAKLIAVTGYGQDSDRNNTREAGFDHHLVKPVDIAELTALLTGIKTR